MSFINEIRIDMDIHSFWFTRRMNQCRGEYEGMASWWA